MKEETIRKYIRKVLSENSNSNGFRVFTADEFIKYLNRDGEYDKRFLYKRDGGHKVFKYFMYDDYRIDRRNVFFFGLVVDGIIVALAHIRKSNKSDDTYWLSYLCVDPEFEGLGYASKLADNMFQWFKEKNLTFETSSYTEQGMVKLKPLFNKLAIKYDVHFKDKGKL